MERRPFPGAGAGAGAGHNEDLLHMSKTGLELRNDPKDPLSVV